MPLTREQSIELGYVIEARRSAPRGAARARGREEALLRRKLWHLPGLRRRHRLPPPARLSRRDPLHRLPAAPREDPLASTASGAM